MSYSLNSSSNDPRVDELQRRHRQRQSRFIMVFALIEGLVIVAALLAVYVLRLVDPDMGIWILVAIAVIGGGILSASLVSSNTRHARDLRDITGR